MSTISTLKYVRINDKKIPVEKWKDNPNLSESYDDLSGAALIIPEDVVIVDFDEDNVDKEGNVLDSKIFNYILEKYKPYWVKSRKNHIHLYFKKPKSIKVENWADYMTLGGFQVDFKTTGGLAIIKVNGKLRESTCKLDINVINNLPELPKICYPLYSNKNKLESMINMVEGDGRDDSIFKHISYATCKYPELDIEEPILFLNDEIFKDSLDKDIVLNKIKRAHENYNQNPIEFKKKQDFQN